MKLYQSDNCGSAGLQRRHASATLFGHGAVRARRCSGATLFGRGAVGGAACRAPTGMRRDEASSERQLRQRRIAATPRQGNTVGARRCSGAACRAPTGSDNRIVITILQDL
ncbi:hypothetical protein RoseRS_2005 [Roseiflexus sp. RS-1]|nr:hypothetical protein RoseRS_2005 [Roseiflexus sp. RS-1]